MGVFENSDFALPRDESIFAAACFLDGLNPCC